MKTHGAVAYGVKNKLAQLCLHTMSGILQNCNIPGRQYHTEMHNNKKIFKKLLNVEIKSRLSIFLFYPCL
jgi:hypothetical protein